MRYFLVREASTHERVLLLKSLSRPGDDTDLLLSVDDALALGVSLDSQDVLVEVKKAGWFNRYWRTSGVLRALSIAISAWLVTVLTSMLAYAGFMMQYVAFSPTDPLGWIAGVALATAVLTTLVATLKLGREIMRLVRR